MNWMKSRSTRSPARTLQPNNPSHSVVTSHSGSRNMKQVLQFRFLHCVAPYLSNGILPPTDYGTIIKSLHTKAVSGSKSFLSHNRALQTASPQIARKETNHPRPYRTTLSQLRSCFCNSIHSYSERIVIPSLLCPPVKWNPTPPPLFSSIPRICHLWPSWTCGSVRAWRIISCRSSLSLTSRLFPLLPLSPLLLVYERATDNHHHCSKCLLFHSFKMRLYWKKQYIKFHCKSKWFWKHLVFWVI